MCQATLLLLMLRVAAVLGAQCTDPQPILAPIKNVTLSNGRISRGVALSIGTPPQDLAFDALPSANNTLIYDETGNCANDFTATECAVFRGGAFVEDNSTTWSAAVNGNASGASQEVELKLLNTIWANDIFHVSSHDELQGFPFGILRTGDLAGNTLGIGRNSTVLNSLKATKAIASRTWSYFAGWTGDTSATQMDGSMVFGGYNAAIASGSNLTVPISSTSEGCNTGLIVTVTDITMELKNGTSVGILPTGRGAAMRACIDPGYPMLTFPDDIWATFDAVYNLPWRGRALGLNLWGSLYDSDAVYDGDLTISISSLNFTIPNHQLVVPDYHLDSQGRPIIANQSQRELLINPLEEINKDDMPLLGRTFLSSAYIMVDEDDQSFALWKANPTTEKKLSLWGTAPECKTPSTPAAPVPSESSGSGLHSEKSTGRKPTGAIVGGTIGAIAAIVFLAAGAFYYPRRQWLQSAAGDAPRRRPWSIFVPRLPPQELAAIPPPVYSTVADRHELSSGWNGTEMTVDERAGINIQKSAAMT